MTKKQGKGRLQLQLVFTPACRHRWPLKAPGSWDRRGCDCVPLGHSLYNALPFRSKEEQKKSIFQKSERGGFRLKDTVQFHLYISTSPCGDARIFSPHEPILEGTAGRLDSQQFLRAWPCGNKITDLH